MLRSIHKASLFLLSGVLVLSPLVVFLALPYVDIGIFRQVETVAVALHLLAAIAALGLMGVSIGNPAALVGAFGLPGMLALALALVAAALSPLSIDPMRSLHGSLEHGVGALWLAELAILSVAATVVRREVPVAFSAAIAACVASVGACALLEAMSLRYGGERLVPYDFKGYLGFTALLAAVPLLALWPRRAWAWAAVAALVAVALFGNRSAALAVAVSIPVFLVASRVRMPRRALAVSAAALLVVGVAGVVAVAPIVERSVAGVPKADGIPSARPIDHVAVQERSYGTIWQRSVTEAVTWKALLASPERFLTGMGFGSFETVAAAQRGEAPGRSFVVPAETSALAYWDGDQKAKFHSHNLWLEALLSAGVVGAALWFGLVVGVARAVPKAALAGATLLVGVLAVSGSLWFFVNSAMPLLAVALASIVPGIRMPGRAIAAPGPREAGWTLGFAAAMGSFAFAGAVAYAAASGQVLERYFPVLMGTPSGPPCVGYNAVAMPNRQINSNLYRMFVRRVEDRKELAVAELAPRFVNLANFSCVMRKYVDEHSDLEALETSLAMRAKVNAILGEGNPVIERVLAPDFDLWRQDLDKWLAMAPSRSDLLIPYFAWVASKKDPGALAAATGHFAGTLREGDPVRSYAFGLAAQARGDAEAARMNMLEAFRLGLGNVFPVPEAAYRQLVGAGTGS